ncbi:diaminopimelate epimerase [Papillibacter cinnamivorans]|uniref:Diaminopimelate epimerase n=1 Tax=Papillibacter cinnamivorans DSM 12816 TaxID=1122930 RepID=A0A1W2CKW9_9FIRM|nr:diaminopimelate epimerase [Papillibacter cinnamivorans]SMC85875.1 diaminopimelate epimerase [Papillibacter cinnamivorans DSM 12816]
MKFTKMQGLGNDYIYINCFEEHLERPEELSRKLSDRHFGVGADGLILIGPSKTADFKMEMYNADGSSGEMCGNGIRCVGRYVHDRGLTDQETITVETGAGIKTLRLHVEDGKAKKATVDMGEPILEPEKIPVLGGGERFIARSVEVGGREWTVTCVSMGNPHAVIFVPETEALNLAEIGPLFEFHPLFPNRINTEFVKVLDGETLQMRVWERGSGETMACGTGACATLVAAVLNGFCKRSGTVRLLGGTLQITWDEGDNHVYMTGPAEFVFDGSIAD